MLWPGSGDSEVGPLLSQSDAVGNKFAALYGRGEARDFVDVDAIRADGRFTDEQLLSAAAGVIGTWHQIRH